MTSSTGYEQVAADKPRAGLTMAVGGRSFYRSMTMLIQTVLDFCTVLAANALAYGLYLEWAWVSSMSILSFIGN